MSKIARMPYSFREGKIVERRWSAAVPVSVKSSREDDMHKHIDYYIDMGTHEYSVDVKGNNAPYEIWLEIKNVIGKNGWLYGDATHIAFDMPEMNGFVLVETKLLREYVSKNVKKEFVNKGNAYKKLYNRRERKDVITYITITDLLSIDHKLIQYSRQYNHPITGDLIEF